MTAFNDDFTEDQKKATFALTKALVDASEEVANETKSLGVSLNALLSAYGNLIIRNGLQDAGAKALRMMAKVLEQEASGLLETPAAGRA